jgi:general secretion pathway protein N
MQRFYRQLKSLFLFAFGAMIVLIQQWPATWLADECQTLSNGRMVLADARGTLWHGSAVLAFRASNNSHEVSVLPSRLVWTLHWPHRHTEQKDEWIWPLHLEHDAVFTQPITLGIGFKITELHHIKVLIGAGQGHLPASTLDGLGTPFNTLRFNGQLNAEWSALEFSSQQTQGDIRLHAQQLSTAASSVRPLGDYNVHLKLTAPIEHSRLTLHTEHGPLFLEGQGLLRQGHFQGTAHAAPEFEPALRGLMSMLGRKNGDTYSLRY